MLARFISLVFVFSCSLFAYGEGVGVSFAPTSRCEYIFIRPPTNEVVLVSSNVTKWVDSYPHIPNGKWVGEIRKIKYTGNPFTGKRLKHEDTAWLWDALSERSETSVGGKMWWDDSQSTTNTPIQLSYGDLSFSNRELFGLLTWTNSFITAHPSAGNQLFDLKTESYPYMKELYEIFSADLTPLKLSYTNFPNRYSPIKKSNYIDLATAISTGTFIREPWLNTGSSPYFNGEIETSTYTGKYQDFTLQNHEYVVSEEELDYTETYPTTSYGTLSWDCSTFREQITYSANWSKPNPDESGFYTSTGNTEMFTWKSFTCTDFKESSGEGTDDGVCYVSTGCNTNILNVGGFERLKQNGYVIITVDVSQYKEQDDLEIEDSEWVVAICEPLTQFLIAGSTGHENLVNDFGFTDGEIVAQTSSTLRSYLESAIEISGITWKEVYMPSQYPGTYSLEELGDIHYPNRMSSVTKARISQSVSYGVAFVTCDMDFQLKYEAQE